MDSGGAKQLHVVFFPFMAHGHMIPTLRIASLFAARGVKATFITTPLNALAVTQALNKDDANIEIEIFTFPSAEAGLPEGCENLNQATDPAMFESFFNAAELFRDQLENYMARKKPDCVVADMFYPWATDCAAKFNIPRLVFHGIGLFSLCARPIISEYKPYKNVSSDEETFRIPFIPHEIKLTRTQLPKDMQLHLDEDTGFKRRTERINESEVKSYGVIVNSFYELEPDYAHFYATHLGRKAWNIGPVSLRKQLSIDRKGKGTQASVDDHKCLKWLNSKQPDSVIYVCFGSTVHFIGSQLREIALGLESSRQHFVWVVRKDDASNSNEWLPLGFEERTKDKGLIIRGWAPQVLILEHQAIGAFVTHCGWNSTLEGISAGKPMVTWPIYADQFYNEKLVTDVLKTGVGVGAKRWSSAGPKENVIKSVDIEKAVVEVMEGDEATERRNRANKLKKSAWEAIQQGGSSYCDLTALITDLTTYHA